MLDTISPARPIENHDDRAIAQNGGAGIGADTAQRVRQRLDDDFFGIENIVDDQADIASARVEHDDEAGIDFGLTGIVGDAEHFLQIDQRHQAVTQAHDAGTAKRFNGMLGTGTNADQFAHGQLRDGETLFVAADDQGRNDRQGQRDLDLEMAALAARRGDIDDAANLFDIIAHHIHADTAAGQIGDFRGRGKSWREDKAMDLLLGHRGELFMGGETLFERLFTDAGGVQPHAVIGDGDDDMATFMEGLQRDDAFFRLAGLDPVGRHFQAVIGGIAHHMGQRILDQFQHLAVELGIAAIHHQFDLLAEIGGDVTDNARQLAPGIADGLHPGLHDPVLQFTGDGGKTLQRNLEVFVLEAANGLHQLVPRQNEF